MGSILTIIFLPLILFWNAFWGRTLITAGDFTGSDLLDMHYPYKVALHEATKNYSLPFWTSHVSNGYPLLAELQAGALYPPNLLLAWLPPQLGLNYSLILAFSLAGLGTYLYARQIFKSDHFSAFLAAIAVMFSAFFVTRIKHLNMIATASIFPFSLYFLKKFMANYQYRWAILTGVALSWLILAGGQNAFACLFIFSLFFLFELYLAYRRRKARPSWKGLLVMIFFAIIFAAPQILPTLEYLQHTERKQLSWEVVTDYPYHPRNLITFILPYFFGNPADGSYQVNIHQLGVFWENASYFGLLPLGLALLTIIRVLQRKETSPYFYFFTGVALLSLLLMLGRFTPFYQLFWNYFPGFKYFRFPTRFNLFLIFCLALLAGRGLSVLRAKNKLKLFVIALTLVDLLIFAKAYLGEIPVEEWQKEPKLVNFFKQEQEPVRIYSLTQYEGRGPYWHQGWLDYQPLLEIRETLPPNQNLVYGLDSFSDRTWFEGGINFANRSRLEKALLADIDSPQTAKLLGMMNVKYLITFADQIGPDFEKIKTMELPRLAASFNVFENKQVLPRAFLVPEAEYIPNQEKLFDRLLAADFNPIRSVLLAKEPPIDSNNDYAGDWKKFQDQNKIEIQWYSDQEVIIKATLNETGFLVLADSFYPGWQATVDGQKQEVLLANFLIRAVQVQAGHHLVRFYYDPWNFKFNKMMEAKG